MAKSQSKHESDSVCWNWTKATRVKTLINNINPPHQSTRKKVLKLVISLWNGIIWFYMNMKYANELINQIQWKWNSTCIFCFCLQYLRRRFNADTIFSVPWGQSLVLGYFLKWFLLVTPNTIVSNVDGCMWKAIGNQQISSVEEMADDVGIHTVQRVRV